MDQEIRTLRDLFLAIWSEQVDAWRNDKKPNKPSTKAREVLNELGTKVPFSNQLTREALLSCLPSETQLASDFKQAYLLLPPSPKAADFVPLMSMTYDLSTTPAKVCIRVTMFCHDGSNLQWLPLRLESGDGMHGFYHAQLGNSDEPKKPSWLPGSQPSFPLCANCPVTLVIALLLTLYGQKETARVLFNHPPHQIKRYKKQLERWVKV